MFWVKGQSAITADWLMILVMQINCLSHCPPCTNWQHGRGQLRLRIHEHFSTEQHLFLANSFSTNENEAFPIAPSWSYSFRSNNWWFGFSTNGFRYELRMARSDKSKHGCIILCEHSSADNNEISIQTWTSFEYCGMLAGKQCPWLITLYAQIYMSSPMSSERLGIISRWNNFFDTIVTFCYHIQNKYHRRLYPKSNCRDKRTACLQQFLQVTFIDLRQSTNLATFRADQEALTSYF